MNSAATATPARISDGVVRSRSALDAEDVGEPDSDEGAGERGEGHGATGLDQRRRVPTMAMVAPSPAPAATPSR